MHIASITAALPTLIIVWAVLTACFVALVTYRGQLTRYENDRLFLSEAAVGERQQSEIVYKINRIQPYVRTSGIAAALFTVLIVAIWTADAWVTIHS